MRDGVVMQASVQQSDFNQRGIKPCGIKQCGMKQCGTRQAGMNRQGQLRGMTPWSMKCYCGFTLIELLTVLAITLVLVTLVYPGYATYVIKARRVEAQAALLELMQKQERYFTQNNTYMAFSADASEPDAKRFRWWSGSTAASSGYELRGEACPDQPISRCIAIKAVPGTARVDSGFRDAACQTLTLTSTGVHAAQGPGPRCWP